METVVRNMLGEISRDEVLTPGVPGPVLIDHNSKGCQIAPGDDGDDQTKYRALKTSHEDKRRQEDEDKIEV